MHDICVMPMLSLSYYLRQTRTCGHLPPPVIQEQNLFSSDPSTWITNSVKPLILDFNTFSTPALTRSALAYIASPLLVPYGVEFRVGSKLEGEGARWTWIDPTSSPSHLGQNRGAPKEASPSTVESCIVSLCVQTSRGHA
jgi:hypothetical protein